MVKFYLYLEGILLQVVGLYGELELHCLAMLCLLQTLLHAFPQV